MDKLVVIRSLFDMKHEIGMKVPPGGSNCAKCEYLREGTDCANKKFQKWMKIVKKALKPWLIPWKVDAYCCDFFEAKKKESKKQASAGVLAAAAKK